MLDAGINLAGGQLNLSGTVSLLGGAEHRAIVRTGAASPVVFASGSTLAFKLTGATVGSGYDQLQATDTSGEARSASTT